MLLGVDIVVALSAALGVGLLALGAQRLRRLQRMRHRLRALALEWNAATVSAQSERGSTLNELAGRLGGQVGQRIPKTVDAVAARIDRAGLLGKVPPLVILGWKVVGVTLGVGVGMAAAAIYGGPGFAVLVLGTLVGWFGIDFVLNRRFKRRRRTIQRDLPTMMDLLVLSLEAGMGLDRALRMVAREYHSAFSDEIHRVLSDLDLGLGRGAAFERMAQRVDLEDLLSLSRAIVQSEELGVSMVGIMQSQSRAVRLARRRGAEASALEAPVKMLLPMVAFILPTLFMLLLGPVALRAGQAFSGVSP